MNPQKQVIQEAKDLIAKGRIKESLQRIETLLKEYNSTLKKIENECSFWDAFYYLYAEKRYPKPYEKGLGYKMKLNKVVHGISIFIDLIEENLLEIQPNNNKVKIQLIIDRDISSFDRATGVAFVKELIRNIVGYPNTVGYADEIYLIVLKKNTVILEVIPELLFRLDSCMKIGAIKGVMSIEIINKKWAKYLEVKHEISLNLEGANLREANLIEANLSAANLKGADLGGANLIEANLSAAKLKGANLREANLEGANLRRADLDRANLREANLRTANLKGADLGGANLIEANLSAANLEGAYLRRAKLMFVNLNGTNLRKAYLRKAYLIGAYLIGADLRKADLGGAYLRRANLRGANLEEARLHGVNLRKANLRKANLRGVEVHHLNLRGADLRGAYLRRANFSYADLSEANLSEANLSEANLEGVNLSYADLSYANLEGVNLRGNWIQITMLSGVGLTGARVNEPNWIEELKEWKIDCYKEIKEKYVLSERKTDEYDYYTIELKAKTIEPIKG